MREKQEPCQTSENSALELFNYWQAEVDRLDGVRSANLIRLKANIARGVKLKGAEQPGEMTKESAELREWIVEDEQLTRLVGKWLIDSKAAHLNLAKADLDLEKQQMHDETGSACLTLPSAPEDGPALENASKGLTTNSSDDDAPSFDTGKPVRSTLDIEEGSKVLQASFRTLLNTVAETLTGKFKKE